MACDLVEGKGRALRVSIHDLAEFKESQLDQSMEAVADTRHEAILFFQKFCNCILDFRVPEEGCDELAGTVRFISAGETAGYEDHLALIDLCSKVFYGLGYLGGSQVVYNEDLGFSPCFSESLGCIVLAVGSREYRDKYLRSGVLDICFVLELPLWFKVYVVRLFAALLDIARIYGLQLTFIYSQKFIEIKICILKCDVFFFCCLAECDAGSSVCS